MNTNTKLPVIGPPRQSLVSVAGTITENDGRFIGGAEWDPEPYRTEGDLGTWKVDASNTAVSGSSITPSVTGAAYGIWASRIKTTLGYDWAESRAQAERKLTTYESLIIEDQLWSDGLGINPGLKLTGDSSTLGGSVAGQSTIKSVGIADQLITETYGRGMLHVRPQVLTQGVHDSVFIKDGNVYVTPMGNLVVAGAGYGGTLGASGGNVGDEFIVASPLVEVHRSPIWVSPDNESEAINRRTNDVTITAWRYVLTVWDYSAGSFHIRTTY